MAHDTADTTDTTDTKPGNEGPDTSSVGSVGLSPVPRIVLDQGASGLLSNLKDTDFTEAISRFQTLQTALQASMATTAKTLNLSLMDFLG